MTFGRSTRDAQAMSDPAVEAAQRAHAEMEVLRRYGVVEALTLSARKALAPLCKLHQRGDRCRCCGHREPGNPLNQRYRCTGCDSHFDDCPTARLVYPSEDLK